jgi:hypothetical protein
MLSLSKHGVVLWAFVDVVADGLGGFFHEAFEFG